MKKAIALILATAVASANVSPAYAGGEKLGKGDYFVLVAPLFDENGTVTPRQLTTGQFDFMLKLDELCRIDAKKYSPSEFKTIFLTLIRNVPSAAFFGGLGAEAGGFTNSAVSAKNYGVYTGVGTAGGSFGAGFTAQAYGKKGFMGSCMTNMLIEARKQGLSRMLDGVNIVYNTFPANGHAIKKSDLPVVTFKNSGYKKNEDAGAATEDTPTPPPPAH